MDRAAFSIGWLRPMEIAAPGARCSQAPEAFVPRETCLAIHQPEGGLPVPGQSALRLHPRGGPTMSSEIEYRHLAFAFNALAAESLTRCVENFVDHAKTISLFAS
jgi:hypothetical protein